MKTFKCSVCKKTVTPEHSTITSGYGLDKNNKKVCYACCGEQDKKAMIEDGKTVLYFDESKKTVTNWPASLVFKVLNIRKSWHNFAGVRYDYWFIFDGYVWHGYTIGDSTQIAHCKRTKQLGY